MNGQTLFAAILLVAPAWAQKKPVTLEVAAAARPQNTIQPNWSPDGTRFLFAEARKWKIHDCARGDSRVLIASGELEAKAKSEKGSGAFEWQNRRVESSRPQWSADGKSIFLAVGGDLFLVDAETAKVNQLTATPGKEEDAQLSPDGARVAYRSNNDLYVLPVAGGKPRRLTTGGSATIWNGRLDWVYPEELQISRAWWWSPDGKQIAYLQFDVSPEMFHPQVDAGPIQAVAEPQRFPKAGTPNANIRLGVLTVSSGRTRWMDIGPTADRLIARVQWMPNGRELAVQRLSRVQDHLELLAFDAITGKSRLLLEERDPAWVNVHNILHFFADGRFLWASERDGFRHLYLYTAGVAKQLTRGEWEVTDLNGVDEQRGVAWVTTTRDSPLERQLYSVNLTSGELKKRTSEPGTHTVSMAPNGGQFIDSWQSHRNAARQALFDNGGNEVAIIKGPAQTDFELLPVENLTVRGKDGTLFYAQLIKPKNFNPANRYPAIVMVYGGPHVQTVRDTWAGANWEQALAQRGYVIWRMDNRGSNYRGHDFEKGVHKQFGKLELAGQLEGLDHLIQLGFVDPSRVGIYGWSYGGYMTLYALTHSKRFAAGVAGAPVTDWRNYDTIYTERYMGLPARNEDGYKASSPVHAAAALDGKLMLVHNFQDDNVLFQNTQHMMAALQLAGKQFETMFYPLKSHGVTGTLRLHMLQAITGFFDRSLRRAD